MRTLFQLSFCGVLMACLTATASAQFGAAGFELDQPVLQRFQSPVSQLGIGQVWFGGNAANHGLGYEGSYASAGTVLELGEDALEGWWNFDARGHISERGNIFTNIGLIRGMYLVPANIELRGSIWYDHDEDQQEVFGRSFDQIAFGAELLHESFGVHFNAYIPVIEESSLTPESCFFGNNILLQQRIDSALRGLDLRLSLRPAFLQPWAGVVDVGTYYYESQVIDGFGGVSTGFTVQPVRHMNVNFQVNIDDRFNTTGFLGLSFHFGGANGRGITPGNRDPELARRNDHIVRFHQDAIFATDPATGRRWEVVHVNNRNANPAGGTGTAENPYTTLTAAETASTEGQIIFVREGDGTTTGMDMGITLKSRQLFLGDGVTHVLPTAERGNFILCNDRDGNKPTITNAAGQPVVVLANDNTVAGFNIDGMNAATNAIQGNATSNAIIRDNMITNMTMHGVFLTGGPTGNFQITNNMINIPTGDDGIHIDNAAATADGTTSTFLVSQNQITSTTGDGIEVTNSTANFTFASNTISGTGENGILLSDSTGIFTFDANTIMNTGAGGAIGDGIRILGGDNGTFTVTNNMISSTFGDGFEMNNHRNVLMTIANNTFMQNNAGDNGIFLQNVNTNTNETITITNNMITGYGNAGTEAGINIDIREFSVGDPNSRVVSSDTINVLISANTVDMNESGIIASVLGATGMGLGPTLNTAITANTSISDNRRNGIRIDARSEAAHRTTIQGNPINRNGINGGSGLELATSGGATAETTLTALVSGNTFTANQGNLLTGTSGIYGEIAGVSAVDVAISNNTIDGAATNNAGRDTGVRFDFRPTFRSPNDNATSVVRLLSNTIQNHNDNGVFFGISGVDQTANVGVLAQGNLITTNGNDGFHVETSNLANATSGAQAFVRINNQNTILSNGGDGVELNANGLTTLLAEITDNNALGGGGFGTNNRGIYAVAMDDSVLVTDIFRNTIVNNFEEGVLVEVGAVAALGPTNAQLFAFLQQNSITGNDSFDVPPANVEGPADVFAHMYPNATGAAFLCLAMQNNIPTSGVVRPYQAFNEGPDNRLRVENDSTNGAPTFSFNEPILAPPFPQGNNVDEAGTVGQCRNMAAGLLGARGISPFTFSVVNGFSDFQFPIFPTPPMLP